MSGKVPRTPTHASLETKFLPEAEKKVRSGGGGGQKGPSFKPGLQLGLEELPFLPGH